MHFGAPSSVLVPGLNGQSVFAWVRTACESGQAVRSDTVEARVQGLVLLPGFRNKRRLPYSQPACHPF